MSNMPEPQLNKLLEAVKNITQGHFEADVQIDAKGILGEMALHINQTLKNLRTLDKSLGENVADAPKTVDEVKLITKKTEEATLMVLDRSDDILGQVGKMRVLQEQLAKGTHSPSSVADSWQQCLDQIEGHTFEVIASQEFQDLTQQKLHKIAASLQDFERRLVDLLIIFKIKEDQSDPSGNVELLKSLHDASVADNNKQDLVDQLLAEFGM